MESVTIEHCAASGYWPINDVRSVRDDERREKIQIIRERIQLAGLKYADVAAKCRYSVSTIKHALQPSGTYENDAAIKLIDDAVYELCVEKFSALYRELFQIDYYPAANIENRIRSLYSHACHSSHSVVYCLNELIKSVEMFFFSENNTYLILQDIVDKTEKLRKCKTDLDLDAALEVETTAVYVDEIVDMIKQGQEISYIREEYNRIKHYASLVYARCRRNIDLNEALYIIKTT